MRPEECLAEVVRLLKLYQILCKDEQRIELQPEPEVKNENDISTDEEYSTRELKSHKEIGQRIYADLKAAWDAVCGDKLELLFQNSTKEDFETATSTIADEVKGLFKTHVQISKKSGAANGKSTDDSNLTYVGLVK